MTNKIKAFTISEMIVVLILMSIVIGMAFTVLSLVQKQMLVIQGNFNTYSELNKLETSLWLDFNRYSEVKYNPIEDKIVFSTSIDSITYKFEQDYIIKKLDTFQIQLLNKQFFFDGNVIENGFIDAVKLEGAKAFQNQSIFVFKMNDARLYIK